VDVRVIGALGRGVTAPLLLSRGDENWAWLRTPHATSDFFDPIKYPRLTKRREDIFLSIGCETRQYLEFFQNELWGSTGEVDNVSWLQRYMLHAELRPHAVRSIVRARDGMLRHRKEGS